MIIDRMIIGGAEKVCEDLIVLLKNRIDLQVLLISPTEVDQFKRIEKDIHVYQLNRICKISIIKAIRCYRILRDFDVLHVHMRHTFRYISLINKIFGLKKYIILHDHYGSIHLNQGLPFLFSKYFKPDFYIGVSNELTYWAQKTWLIPGSKCKTLTNLPSLKLVRQNIYASNDNFVIVGNFKRVKNQIFALELSENLNIKIDLIGQIQDENYFEDVVNVYPEGSNYIHNINNVSEILERYKFGLCCSLSESGPLVILEYFVNGLPFLAYKTGGISDILYKYVPQYFLDTFDLQDWIVRYNELNNNYSRISNEIIEEVLFKEFNRDGYFNKLLSIYSNVE